MKDSCLSYCFLERKDEMSCDLTTTRWKGSISARGKKEKTRTRCPQLLMDEKKNRKNKM